VGTAGVVVCVGLLLFKVDIVLIIVGYLAPMILQIIFVVYLKELVKCKLLVITVLPFPVFTFMLAGLMPSFHILGELGP